MSDYVAVFFKLMIAGLLVVLFVAIWGVGLAISDVSNFKQRVNYTIEQHGGLTTQAVEALEAYAKKNSQGHYQITSAQKGQKVGFGETIHYEITCTFSTHIPAPKEITHTVTGSAVSQIR